MKTFIYTLEYKKAKYGSNVTTTVWQIKNNVPMYIGERRYNTGSFRGHNHEAMQVIIDAKLLPKNYQKGSYIDYDKQELYRLIELQQFG